MQTHEVINSKRIEPTVVVPSIIYVERQDEPFGDVIFKSYVGRTEKKKHAENIYFRLVMFHTHAQHTHTHTRARYSERE